MAVIFKTDNVNINNVGRTLRGYASTSLYNIVQSQQTSVQKYNYDRTQLVTAEEIKNWVSGILGDEVWCNQTIFCSNMDVQWKNIFKNRIEGSQSGLTLNRKYYDNVIYNGKTSNTMKYGRLRYRRDLGDSEQHTFALGLEGYVDSPTATCNYMAPYTSQGWQSTFSVSDSISTTYFYNAQFRLHCMPEEIFSTGKLDYSLIKGEGKRLPRITLTCYYRIRKYDPVEGQETPPDEYNFNGTLEIAYTDLLSFSIIPGEDIFDKAAANQEKDSPVQPGNPDDSENPSAPGGGGGGYDPFSDPVDFPDVPPLGVTDTGLVTLWSLQTAEEIFDFYRVLWTTLDDVLINILKLFNDPVDAIISFGIIPFIPSFSSPMQVYFGNVEMKGIQWPRITSQYSIINMGSITIEPYYGSFLDYSPFTKVKLYLPYVGWVDIDADEVMNIPMEIQYTVDCLTGDCIAFIKCGDAVKYTFNGNCLTKVPITSSNAQEMFMAMADVVGKGITTAATFGSAAFNMTAAGKKLNSTSDSLDRVFGNTPTQHTQMSDVVPQLTSLASSCGNVIGSKGGISHGSLLSSGIGYMGRQRPYVIIEYPDSSRPEDFNKFFGNRSNVNVKVGDCNGFLQLQSFRLSGIPATSIELNEIENLLKSGVIV